MYRGGTEPEFRRRSYRRSSGTPSNLDRTIRFLKIGHDPYRTVGVPQPVTLTDALGYYSQNTLGRPYQRWISDPTAEATPGRDFCLLVGANADDHDLPAAQTANLGPSKRVFPDLRSTFPISCGRDSFPRNSRSITDLARDSRSKGTRGTRATHVPPGLGRGFRRVNPPSSRL